MNEAGRIYVARAGKKYVKIMSYVLVLDYILFAYIGLYGKFLFLIPAVMVSALSIWVIEYIEKDIIKNYTKGD